MTALQHYLRPLLAPASVALVGASDKPASLGRIVLENLLEGGFKGDLYAVNPNHRRLLGRRCFASLAAIGKPVELALIAVPCAAVTGVLDDAARCGVKAAVILSAPPLDDGDARRWQRDVLATAKKRRIRLLGPHAFGVIRTSIGLNATMGAGLALPGRLALIAQSGAVCTAMLNFASPNGIGFSTVVAIGGAYDIGFGELLDALVNDPQTDGILVYVEKVSDARRFLSALRAAARTKPVVVLRAGRSSELQHGGIDADAPPPDAVFDAAMRRAGTVRVRSYAQLFAAARILSMGKLPRGDHLAIVTNGHGPGTMAADSAADRGVPLAVLSAQTEKALAALLPANVAIRNPVNVRGDATPERMAAAVSAALADPQVDAVLALHVQRPATGATDVARAVAEVARAASKPVLGAWLGAIGRREVRDALEAGGVPDFYTPEHAVEAFSFLAAYRHNQKWLLEVPAPQPEPEPPDTTEAERVREEAGAANHTVLTDWQTQRLLRAFGLPVEVAVPVGHAQGGARRRAPPGLSGRAQARHIRAASARAGVARLARPRQPAQRARADQGLRRPAGGRAGALPARRLRRSRAGGQGAADAGCARGGDRRPHRRGVRAGDHLRQQRDRSADRQRAHGAAAAAQPSTGDRSDQRQPHGSGAAGEPRRSARPRTAGAHPAAGVEPGLRAAVGQLDLARSGARRRRGRRDRRGARQ